MERIPKTALGFFILILLFWTSPLLNAQFPHSIERSNVELEYELDTFPELNSEWSEFAPVLHDRKLIFTSDRDADLLNRNMQSWGRNAYLSLFWVDIASVFDSVSFRNVRGLSSKINIQDHTGPLSFSSDGKTAYFTRVSQEPVGGDNGEKVKKPQLFQARYVDGQWKEVRKLDFVDKEVSYANPTVMGEGERLFFSSDKEGGPGGTDIFQVEATADGWSEPEPLPEPINTEARESFPYYTDSTLFFSSERPGGMGGLDIYCSFLREDGSWSELHHFPAPLNSEGDDLGLVLLPNKEEGFFSSDREGGEGMDDIYGLRIIENVIVEKEGVAGQFKYRQLEGDHPEGMTVELVDESGEVIMRTQTDKDGRFNFKELPADTGHSIRLMNKEADVELVMSGEKDGVALMKDGEGRFVYRKLPGEKVGAMELSQVSDPGNDPAMPDLTGQFVYEKLPSEKAGERTVQLVDGSGDVVMETETDERGNFDFDELPGEKDLKVRLKNTPDEDLKLLVYDEEGKVGAQLKSGGDGVFDYRRLQGDRAEAELMNKEDPDLEPHHEGAVYGKFEYKKLDGEVPDSMRIKVVDGSGKVQFVSEADSGGFFRFVDISLQDSMMFQVMDGVELEGKMIVKIMDRYGEVVAVLHKDDRGFFVYRQLEGERAEASLMNKEDESGPVAFDEKEEEDPEEEEQEETEEGTEEKEGEEEEPEEEEPEEKEPEEDEPEEEEPEEAETPDPPRDKEDAATEHRILFEENSSYLGRKGLDRLDQLAGKLKGGEEKIRIEGHASANGPKEYNDWISERRAKRVKEQLVSSGVKASRIEVEWYGEDRLVNDCREKADCSEEEHGKNRRVELKLSP